MFWGVSYILYTCNLHHNFGPAPTVDKFNPQLIFHNSNTRKPYVLLLVLRGISELRRPIAVKFCHIVGSLISFIMPVPKFGACPPKKKLRAKTC